jgi:hypothetical protein
VEYQESYQGRLIIVTTKQETAGAWTSVAEVLVDAGRRVTVVDGQEGACTSEDEARRAGFSAAAAAIDRARATRGKP